MGPPYADAKLIEKFTLHFKRGKFIESLYGNFSKTFNMSEEGKNQAIG